MANDLSGGLIGLSMLTGVNLAGQFSGVTVESRAVRVAKAQFKTPETTPPWKEKPSSASASAQLGAIKRMATIIDRPGTGREATLPDVQTTFTTYKALDRLRIVAEAAARPSTTAVERKALQSVFAKGMNDLQTYLASAPTDKVSLFFGPSARRADSVPIAPATKYKIDGRGIVATRDAPLSALSGTEKFSITLSKPGASDTVTVDLAQGPQPPTIDSVASALNAAIASIPMRNIDGTIALDADGNPRPRWAARFEAKKTDGKWGFSLDAPSSVERVSIDQLGAKDALMVATGLTADKAVPAMRILRFDDPTGAMQRHTLGTISAVDADATERAKLAPPPRTVKGVPAPTPADVPASTTARAIVTDAQGFSYVVGTTSGDIGSNLSTGRDDLFLTKLDSEGAVVWQRSLGAAGSAQGAAISLAPDGDIVVAGTVQGNFSGSNLDGDLVVARFSADGDERFATAVRTVGADSANAVAVGADGTIFVGGTTSGGEGNAFIARVGVSGRLEERRTIEGGGSDTVNALAVDGNGDLLALTREGGMAKLRRIDTALLATDLGSLDLGQADARVLAIAGDGTIAVAGATLAALSGTQVNAKSGGRDGFVARIDSDLGGADVTYVGTAGDDQIDSIAFMGDTLYAGGRTTGDLDGTRSGIVDGFVTRLDAGTGAIENSTQFGQGTFRSEPVRLGAVTGGASVLGALGFHRGTLNPENSVKLVAQTSVRAGDTFSFRVAGGSLKKIVIEADDTLKTLSERIQKLTGSKIKVSAPLATGGNVLRIEPKAGASIELIAGPEGRDALSKLGIEPARINNPVPPAENAPRVRPGGTFGLSLTEALSLATEKDASLALGKIKEAISMSQTAYRSLYWDAGKAALADGAARSGRGAGPSAYQQAQAGRYQAALERLSSGPVGIIGL